MAIIGSGIDNIEETIAKTMGEIGWPGADQVLDDLPQEAPAEEIVEEEDPVVEASDDEEEEPQEEAEEQPEEPATPTETTYQPKWKKAALEVLSKLPPEQAELLRAEDKRREENFHKGIEQYRNGHAAAKEWEEVITPYRATIDRFQVKPQEAIKTLLATDHTLRYGQKHEKLGTIFQVMQNYGIDPADIVGVYQNVHNQPQNEPLDPRVMQMEQRLRSFEQQQYSAQQQAQLEQQRQMEEQNRAANEMVAKFAEDPDHEHFELLKPLMGGYLQQGAAKDLDEAYEMAFRAHPQTAQLWIAQQQQQIAETRKAAVAKAKKVTNVRSNGRASVSTPTAPATMEETIAREAQRLGLA